MEHFSNEILHIYEVDNKRDGAKGQKVRGSKPFSLSQSDSLATTLDEVGLKPVFNSKRKTMFDRSVQIILRENSHLESPLVAFFGPNQNTVFLFRFGAGSFFYIEIFARVPGFDNKPLCAKTIQ